MDTKTWAMLSDDELKERAKLTPAEQKAVDNFIAAARVLPSSICISVGDEDDDEHLSVSKRTTRGSAQQVASLRKKSLCF